MAHGQKCGGQGDLLQTVAVVESGIADSEQSLVEGDITQVGVGERIALDMHHRGGNIDALHLLAIGDEVRRHHTEVLRQDDGAQRFFPAEGAIIEPLQELAVETSEVDFLHIWEVVLQQRQVVRIGLPGKDGQAPHVIETIHLLQHGDSKPSGQQLVDDHVLCPQHCSREAQK